MVCPTRERLADEYRRVSRQYQKTLATVIDTMTVEQAREQTQMLFDACVQAQESLRVHELSHECGVKAQAKAASSS
jgi:hypothetical protein